MIYFVGAGPGDADLITVKGRKLIESCDSLIYAGSLVSKEHLKYLKKQATIFDSSKMNLDEILNQMKINEQKNIDTVRLHTGDPTIYGAIKEQMDGLDRLGISYEVIPGVSSATASCAALKEEFTIPELSQTVIFTRLEGKTSVPEGEKLRDLASHRASMSIFLSVSMIEKVYDELLAGYKDPDLPCAVVYKVTWEDEKIFRIKLRDLVKTIRQNNINKHAQILVGYFLNDNSKRSKLYDKNFETEYRKCKE